MLFPSDDIYVIQNIKNLIHCLHNCTIYWVNIKEKSQILIPFIHAPTQTFIVFWSSALTRIFFIYPTFFHNLKKL